jgi:hypothetical protein
LSLIVQGPILSVSWTLRNFVDDYLGWVLVPEVAFPDDAGRNDVLARLTWVAWGIMSLEVVALTGYYRLKLNAVIADTRLRTHDPMCSIKPNAVLGGNLKGFEFSHVHDSYSHIL